MIESFWWIIYIMKENKPYFLVIKRLSIRWNVEWTAPKWKSEVWENSLETAKREIFEETWIEKKYLEDKWIIGDFFINLQNSTFQKKVTYFLFQYYGDEKKLQISNSEGYIWIYNWLQIENVLNLIHYSWLRELYRKAYEKIMKK